MTGRSVINIINTDTAAFKNVAPKFPGVLVSARSLSGEWRSETYQRGIKLALWLLER